VVAILTFLIGGALLGIGLYHWIRLQDSKGWPQAIGTVAKSWVEEGKDSDGCTSYTVCVQYDYTVQGMHYSGKRVRFGGHSYSRAKRAQAELDRYPASGAVPVFYDPENPAEAVLLRESPLAYILMIFGVLMLGLAVAQWLHMA